MGQEGFDRATETGKAWEVETSSRLITDEEAAQRIQDNEILTVHCNTGEATERFVERVIGLCSFAIEATEQDDNTWILCKQKTPEMPIDPLPESPLSF